jgi:DNA-binding CsgD family transcriptional regulator/tetratricopeptide (TPR) repeat protein
MSKPPREVFVGRRPELALISRRLEGARTGQGCFIAISGEPGIGKTRLAQAAAGLASSKGFSVFLGQCHDGQYIPPYWPWKQLLREMLKVLPSRSSAQGKAIVNALSGIVADAHQPAQSPAIPAPTPEEERLRILESSTQLLRLFSERGPVLLVIDNLHCADVPSLQLLQFISRELSGNSLAIIGSYREPSAETGNALRESIGALAGQAFFESIALSGWDLAGVEECLRLYGTESPPELLTRAVHGRTEGNPLFVLEVVRLLQREGLLSPGTGSSARSWETYIPPKVRLAILGLFERLSAPCRDALAAGAVVGREFESSLLREIVQQEDPAVEELLEEALAHGPIEEIPEKPGWYRFAHALVQDVVREQTPGPRKSTLHLRTALALERRHGKDIEVHAGELARHFDAAGSDHAEQAIVYYQQAGERALRMCGYEDAHEQFRRAIDLGGGRIHARDLGRLLFGLAKSQHGLGTIALAAETHARAFDLFVQNGQIEDAVRIFEQPLILMEKPARLTSLIEKAISFAGPSTLRGLALGGKYGLALYHDTGDYPKAASIFESGLKSARQSGDFYQELAALTNWGRVEADELRFDAACELVNQAISLAMEKGDLWIEAVARAALVPALLGLGRLHEAETQARLLLKHAARFQTPLWTAAVTTMLFAVLRQKGDLAAASQGTSQALSLGAATYRIWNLADRVLFEYETGSPGEGARLLQEVVAGADAAEVVFKWEGWLALLIAGIAWLTGEPLPLPAAEAAARKVPLTGGLRRGDAVTVSVGLGLIAALREDRGAAARHYEKLLPFQGLVVCPYLGMTADHILAVLASTSGEAAAARGHFDAALAFCRSNGLALETAYTCRDYAELCLRLSARADTQKVLDLCTEGIPIAEKAGAVPLAERLRAALASAGQRRAGRPSYPDSLSEREVDVLRLLAEGLSNAQIGEKLFISLHTVANHVQSILQKTRAANRTEAAAYAIRHNLGDPGRQTSSQR